ncbi:MAG: M48 family metallopeptidase [Campylobacteraceae bacterium]|jgi:Zn-dependent protease with chaperone function|nr:M48 family metallopeptidase [Campylobacteraceae bacterium]
MNFFERQNSAKRKTKFLIVLFLLGVFGVCFGISYAIGVLLINNYEDKLILSPISIYQNMSPELLLYPFFGAFTVIIAGSLYKISQLSNNSGVFIAKSLDGKLLTKRTANANELMLLNIVDEMSIASGIPSPPVYLMDKDDTINAFAAGMTYDDAVIGVTKGAVELLTREELQGVIAHEFSHIFNGDMKLNIRSIGILHGILCISLVGEFIARSARNSRKNGGGVILIGISLYVVGYIGLFFGSLIKAAINKEREYLADASATQFTRYPKGLASALKKIGGTGSVISSAKADEFSHLYFSNGVKNFFSFSTHPPLEKRIRALEPNWDGSFILPKPVIYSSKEIQKSTKKNEEKIQKTITIAAVLNEINNIGDITFEKLDKASQKIDKIPKFLYDGTADALKAQLTVFALLLDKNKEIQKLQTDIIERDFFTSNKKEIFENFESIKSMLSNLSRDTYLKLIQIAMPTLKTLTKEQYFRFKTTIISLVEADKNISWFELNLKYLVLYPLDITFGIRKIPQEVYSRIEAIKYEIEIILSAITYSQFLNDKQANEAFLKAMKAFNITALKYIFSKDISWISLENAYWEVQKAKLHLRKKILEMVVSCLKTDFDKLLEQDIETVHAISALLHLPVSID